MATTVTNDVIEMTDAGDEFAQILTAQSIRFVGEAGSLAADVITLTDPVTTGVLWTSFAGGPFSSESELTTAGDKSGRTWPNGVRLDVLTGNRGTVYIRFL